MLTNADIQSIKDKLAELTSDKADADAKTQASNEADTAAKVADAAAAQAKLDEAAADAKVNAEFQDLLHFVEALAAPSDPPADPPPAA